MVSQASIIPGIQTPVVVSCFKLDSKALGAWESFIGMKYIKWNSQLSEEERDLILYLSTGGRKKAPENISPFTRETASLLKTKTNEDLRQKSPP